VPFAFASPALGAALAVGLLLIASLGASAFALDVEAGSVDGTPLALGAAIAIGGALAGIAGAFPRALSRIVGARHIAQLVARRPVIPRDAGVIARTR
jgi:hypothetical protein